MTISLTGSSTGKSVCGRNNGLIMAVLQCSNIFILVNASVGDALYSNWLISVTYAGFVTFRRILSSADRRYLGPEWWCMLDGSGDDEYFKRNIHCSFVVHQRVHQISYFGVCDACHQCRLYIITHNGIIQDTSILWISHF